MDRRRFLTTTTLSLAAHLPGIALAQERSFTPTQGRWRTFEVVTRVEIADARRATQAWVPVPSITNDWQVAQDSVWTTNANAALFGGWEGNGMAYNVAHDVALPGSRGAKLGFLMYPQAETRGERVDSLDPDTFKYTITTREIAA